VKCWYFELSNDFFFSVVIVCKLLYSYLCFISHKYIETINKIKLGQLKSTHSHHSHSLFFFTIIFSPDESMLCIVTPNVIFPISNISVNSFSDEEYKNFGDIIYLN
jgi:hypothetical protein